MGALGATTVWIIALGLLWLVLATAVSLLAARRLELAQRVIDAARSNAALLELTPARPLLIRPDRRTEADPLLARDLGLRAEPHRLADLVGDDYGIADEDLEALVSDVDAAQVSAGRRRRRRRARCCCGSSTPARARRSGRRSACGCGRPRARSTR
jgi:hypothetical protein